MDNNSRQDLRPELRDYGPNPFVIDIEEATKENTNFRLALWTGITCSLPDEPQCRGRYRAGNAPRC